MGQLGQVDLEDQVASSSPLWPAIPCIPGVPLLPASPFSPGLNVHLVWLYSFLLQSM